MPERIVEITCHGRARGKERKVLEQPVVVKVRLARNPGEPCVYVRPTDCPRSVGCGRQWCNATSGLANCPFNFDFPQIAHEDPEWRIPEPLTIPLGLVALPDADD